MQIRKDRKKDRKLKVAIRDYSECNEIFWGIESFNHSLEEEGFWNADKYWKLEYFLIKLCQSLEGDEFLHRNLAANLHYLSSNINNLIESHKDSSDFYNIKDIDEDKVDYCRDRLNHIMRILWGRILFNSHDYMITSNPLIQKELNLSK